MKKRCIELEVVKVEDNKVTFKIVKQSHREYGFCQQIDSNEFFASNGYKLVSYANPAFNSESHELFCQGEFTKYNNDEIDCNLEDFAKICEATTEYNTTDGKGYEKPWPKLNDKYYIVSNCGEVLQYNFDGCIVDLELKNIGNFFESSKKQAKLPKRLSCYLRTLNSTNYHYRSQLTSWFLFPNRTEIEHKMAQNHQVKIAQINYSLCTLITF